MQRRFQTNSNKSSQDRSKTLRKKGIDSISLDDYSNYMFTTNNENCFKSALYYTGACLGEFIEQVKKLHGETRR